MNKQKFKEHLLKTLGVDGWKKVKQAFEDAGGDPEKMAEATLADGTVITYDKLEPGGKVMVVSADGEIIAPDAEHVLADGTKIKTVGGLITEVEKEVEMNKNTLTAEVVEKMISDAIANIKPASSEDMSAQFNSLKAKYDDLHQNFSKVIKVVDFLVEEANTESEKQKFSSATIADKRKTVAELISKYSIKTGK